MADEADTAVYHYDTFMNHFLANNHAKVVNMSTPLEGDGPRYCEDCGEEIPPERIKAIPGARRCVQCQEVYDVQ